MRGYVALAVEAGAPAACCTLTSAARDAENSGEMVSALESLGLSPLVIPGRIEGSLTFLGVAQDFRGRRILVADNGGGSTELALGSLGEDGALDLTYVRSVDVGCRRVTEKYLQAAPLPTAGDLAAAHAFVAEGFAPAVEEGGLWAAGSERAVAGAPEALVVCGGTVTSLVAMDAELEPYDSARVHLASLTREKVEALEARLAGLTVEQRAELPGLQAKRAPVDPGRRRCHLRAHAPDVLLGASGERVRPALWPGPDGRGLARRDGLAGGLAPRDACPPGAPAALGWYERARGGVAELAYAGDLKSLAARIVGSSPTAPTSDFLPGNCRPGHFAVGWFRMRLGFWGHCAPAASAR